MNEGIKMLLVLVNGLVYLAVGGLWFLGPESKTLNFSITILAFGLTSFLLYTGREDIKKVGTEQQVKGWVYKVSNLFLVITILAFLNYLSFKNSSQMDLSETQVNSISSVSQNVIKGLKSDLMVTVFANREQSQTIVSILDLYRQHKKNIQIDVQDPDLRPDLVKKEGIEKSNTVVMEYEKRKQYVTEHNELNYTNAFKKLGREKDPIVYYTVGHLELDFDNEKPEGGLTIAQDIEKTLAIIRPLDLLSKAEVPLDADMLLIWGPQRAFFPQELRAVQQFLERGGRLMVALDPVVLEDKIISLRQFFKKSWELYVPNTILVDKKSHVDGSNGTVPLVKDFDFHHPLTRNFLGQIFFPLTSTIEYFPIGEGRAKFSVLARSTEYPGSWIDYTPLEIVSGALIYNKEKDQKGPGKLVAMWEENQKNIGEDKAGADPNQKSGSGQGTLSNDFAVKNSRKPIKIAMFANSSFVQNQYSNLGDNYLFFLKVLNYLTSEDEIQSLNLPLIKNSPILISESNMKMVFYASVVLPVCLFMIGYFFYRRRSRVAKRP